MAESDYPEDFLRALRAVKAKRLRTVIEYILEHGSINTEELRELGYKHPPRAARDVREQGIPLETKRIPRGDGRTIASYTFGDPENLVAGLKGRTPISRRFKLELIKHLGEKCCACGHKFEVRYLQVDHRVPVEVGGDEPDSERSVDRYMLLDGACNRAKSWSCENCPNYRNRQVDVCETCYWAIPEGQYEHIATVQQRRVVLIWSGDAQVGEYTALVHDAEASGRTVQEYIQQRLRIS